MDRREGRSSKTSVSRSSAGAEEDRYAESYTAGKRGASADADKDQREGRSRTTGKRQRPESHTAGRRRSLEETDKEPRRVR